MSDVLVTEEFIEGLIGRTHEAERRSADAYDHNLRLVAEMSELRELLGRTEDDLDSYKMAHEEEADFTIRGDACCTAHRFKREAQEAKRLRGGIQALADDPRVGVWRASLRELLSPQASSGAPS